MGYTHYWRTRNRKVVRARLGLVLEDFERLLPHLPPLAGPDGTGRPVLDPERGAAFNGRAPRDYEGFVFDPGERGLQFCKTGFSSGDRRPYDRAVTAFLILARVHMGEALEVLTDGYLLHWTPAARMIEAHLHLPVDLESVLGVGFYVVEDARGRTFVAEGRGKRHALSQAQALEEAAERLGLAWPYHGPYRVRGRTRLPWDRLKDRRLFGRSLGVYAP
jgi:hypothetical protein